MSLFVTLSNHSNLQHSLRLKKDKTDMSHSNELNTREAKKKLVMVGLNRADFLLKAKFDHAYNAATSAADKSIANAQIRQSSSQTIDMVRPLAEVIFLASTELYDVINNVNAGMQIGEAMFHIVEHKAEGTGFFSQPKLFGPFDCKLEFAWAQADGKDSLTLKVVANDAASADYATMASELLAGLKLWDLAS